MTTFAPTDRNALDIAINAWISGDRVTYGSDINAWDVSAITDMSNLFYGQPTFNSDISAWNVSNVTSMSRMFMYTPNFMQNIRMWSVGATTSLDDMFNEATAMLIQGASITPLYTYFNQVPLPPTFAPADRTALDNAITAWISGDRVTYGSDINAWDVSAITDMSNLFYGQPTFNSDISAWNVSNVTTMVRMFMYSGSFNQNIRSWSVGATTSLDDMFSDAPAMLANQGASATPLYTYFNQGSLPPTNTPPSGAVTISGIATEGQILTASNTLTDADGPAPVTVFYQWKRSPTPDVTASHIGVATGLTYTLLPADVGNYISVTASYTDGLGKFEKVTSAPTAMISAAMISTAFAPADRTALDSAITAWISGDRVTYGSDINTWDVSAITDMSNLFYGQLTFDSDISAWNVSNVTTMVGMFWTATIFNQPLNSWNVSNVTDMTGMFSGTTAFNQPLNSWNMDQVTDMTGMFIFATAFNQPINSWNVSQVTTMNATFLGATAFDQPLNLWNVGQVTDMSSMFSDASAFNQDIRTWNVGQSTNLDNMFSGAQAMIDNQGASATPTTAYMNQAPQPPTGPTGPALMPVAFVLPQLNASLELSAALSIIGDYTPPAAFALPTITLSMPASQFNDGLFQLALTDSNINTLVNPAAEAVYYSEKITYYASQSKFPELKDTANVRLKDLPVVNGAAHVSTHLRQRPGALSLPESMVHELAYQLIGVSLMDDQLANGVALKDSIRSYLDTTLPAFVKLQLANCDGKTQNINGATDLITRENVTRELFMQIVESVVGGVDPVTGSAKSSRLNSLFDASNFAEGKYGIKFIAGDTLRFSIKISPHSTSGAVTDVDYIVDGVLQSKQEARTVELVITMV